ncbi:MAG: RNA 3'-terminal phosphate cyclase [Candidatus Woesearchaeota archaeon]
MIEVDGNIGGGQMLRTALGLSAITQKPFKIINIRGNKGLKTQHLECVNATARLCDAEVEGAALNSKEITFLPHTLNSGRLNVNIATAGSVGLVLQALLIAGTSSRLRIKIEGGATYGKWAPPIDFLENILFPHLSNMGYKISILKNKDGFYPKGGALVEVQTERAKLSPITIVEKGRLLNLQGISVASSHLEKARVGERQAKSAMKTLFPEFGDSLKIKALYRDSLCPGTGITLWAVTENSIIGSDSLGERDKRAEQVGREAAEKLIYEYNNAAVDSFTADQLMPYMALAGDGKIRTSKITGHIKTNAGVIEKFLDVKFEINGNVITCTRNKR